MYDSEDDARAALEVSSGASQDESLDLSAHRAVGGREVEVAMRKGWYALANDLVHVSRQYGLDLSSRVFSEASKIQRELRTLTKSMSGKKGHEKISPSFQWAQGAEQIFLSVKMSHKWDAPATLGCKIEVANFSRRSVGLGATCPNKGFFLSLDLLRDISPENSSWTMGAVGRVIVTLQKAEKATWSRLSKQRTLPTNAHVWHDKKKAHEEEMKALFGEEEEERKRRREGEKRKENEEEVEERKEAGEGGGEGGDASEPSKESTDSTKSSEATESSTNPSQSTPSPPPQPSSSLRLRLKEIDARLQRQLEDINKRSEERKKGVDKDATKAKVKIDKEAAEERKKAREQARQEREEVRKGEEEGGEEEL